MRPPLATTNPALSPYGVNVWDVRLVELQALRDLGIKHVRIQAYWCVLEQSRGTYNWDQSGYWASRRFASALEAMHLAGISITVAVTKAPEWAYGADGQPDPVMYAEFCRALLRRFPYLRDIQIGNEEGKWGHDSPFGNQVAHGQLWTPSAYAATLRECYGAIKEIAPSCLVATQGVWGLGTTTATPALAEYAERLYQAGIGAHYDVLAAHIYCHYYKRERPGDRIPGELDALRACMSRHGDGDKQLWVTEFGYGVPNTDANGKSVGASGVNSERDQADYLAQTYAIFRDHGVQRGYWYQLRNDCGMALVHTHFVPGDDRRRPAWTTMRGLIRRGT